MTLVMVLNLNIHHSPFGGIANLHNAIFFVEVSEHVQLPTNLLIIISSILVFPSISFTSTS